MRYFDTSFLAPLILEEATSTKIEAFFAKLPLGELYVSHWTRVEFASLIAREVRMGGLAESDALLAIAQFDELVADSFQVLAPGVADFELAKAYIQHFATKLRAGDALPGVRQGNADAAVPDIKPQYASAQVPKWCCT